MKYLGRRHRAGQPDRSGDRQFGSRESPGAKSGCHSQRRPRRAVADVLSWSNWRRNTQPEPGYATTENTINNNDPDLGGGVIDPLR